MKSPLKNNKKEFDCTERIYKIFMAVMLIVFAIIQFSRITNLPWDWFDTWRQSDTYSIALNYYQYDMNPFRPQFNYDGASDIYVQLELQIVPWISAVIFKLIGTTTPVVPRFFSFALFSGAAVFLANIAKRFTNRISALCAMAIFMFMPLSLGIAHATMPEAGALFFYISSMYFLLKWLDGERDFNSVISAILLSFAIMLKLPIIFMGLTVLFVFIWKKKVFSKYFFIYGAIAILPVVVYYVYAGSVATLDFVSGIATKHTFTEEIFSIFTKPGIEFFRDFPPKLIGYVPLAGALSGLIICLTVRRKKNKFLTVWAITILLELVTIVAMIRFGYYLAFFLPVVALLCSVAIYELLSKSILLAIALITAIIVNLGIISPPYWIENTKMHQSIDTASKVIAKYIKPDETFAIGVLDPAYINAANRHGWRANIKYYDYIPEEPEAEINWFIENGVSYFVVVDGAMYNDLDYSYMTYLAENLPIYAAEDNCTIFSLK